MRRYNDAEQGIDKLERQFPRHRQDVSNGLRCKLLLRLGKWREAPTVWNMIVGKTEPVNQRHLMQILGMKSQDASVTLSERKQAEQDCQSIRTVLGVDERSFIELSDEEDYEIAEE
jgi:hypothetical protein